MFAEMQRNMVRAVVVCFSALFILAQPIPTEAISLPIVMNSQGFTIAITYYSVAGPNTILLVGSVENDGSQTVKLMSLRGIAFIHGVNVGSGSLDQQYLTLPGAVVVPASATIITDFNIYMALGTATVMLGNGSTLPFNYTTPITVTITASICVPEVSSCLPWPFPVSFNQTGTLGHL
jgi:hypothetical protein